MGISKDFDVQIYIVQVINIYFYIDFTKSILYNITIEQTMICLYLFCREGKEKKVTHFLVSESLL